MDEIEREEQAEESQSEEIILGTIDSITSEGVTIVIDGDDAAGQKEYKVNCSVQFVVGDRVKLTRNSGTYIVDFVVGNPMERFPIPAGGSDGQYLAKDGANNYAVKWVTPPAIHNIPSGGTTGQVLAKSSDNNYAVSWITLSLPHGIPAGGNANQILAKSSGNDYAVSWIDAPHELPSGGTANQVLVKNSASNYDVKWVTIESAHGIPSGGTTGQVLKKNSNTNYDVTWGSAPSPTALTNGSYTVSCSSGYFYPSSGTISLGSNNGYWNGCYIKGSMRFGDSSYSPNAIGFFGKTPVSKQTLYTSSTLANVIALLQAYGLG